jgi:hypothetical protein
MRMAAFWPTRSPTGEVVKVGFGRERTQGRGGRSIHQPHAAPSSRVFRPMALISAARRLGGKKAESLDGGPSHAPDDG